MTCTSCGKEIQSSNKFCPHCGSGNLYYVSSNSRSTVDAEPYSDDPYDMLKDSASSHQKYSYQEAPVQTESKAGLVVGIVGLFVAGIILGIIALVLANKPNTANKRAVMVLGIIDIIGGIIFIIMQNNGLLGF